MASWMKLAPAAAGAALALAVAACVQDRVNMPTPGAGANANANALTTAPTTQWITNGGTLFNQRYSPLDQINRDTVAGLKAEWRTSLNGSGTSQNNSGETQPLYVDGVLYVSTGDADVFALDVDTGAILWSYTANVDPASGVTCCGWANRGVAMGDGKVFVGREDARLVALDQNTGEVVWDIAAEDWHQGFSITAAPLYYDGMVITGFSGGEMGMRGRIKAFDAETGDPVWTFFTVPEPGERGSETWTDNSEFWKHGGAPVWQTPAVDPDLGFVYFSTGNPAPDLNGSARPGDNLYSNSIVALDVHTGEYRWHFQEVHHDLWDYDAPNPIILFDAEVRGTMRQGLVQVGKTGWAYILDRRTGKPLIGIQERPVPQEPRQATAATQPYPVGDSIVPQQIDADPEGMILVNGGRIFTPFWTDPVALKPATMGGANWPPSAYDPETNLLYVCATDRVSVFSADGEEPEIPEPNTVFMGGRFTGTDVADRGIFAALDVTTNRLVWRQQWNGDICYSGAVVTAGGLVFVGRNDGRLTALDKSNGLKLWEFQTDAGVNTTVTTFERNGTQYVAVLAGGSVFGGSKRGDGVWLFSLNGTTNSLPPGSASLTAAAAGPPRGPRPTAVAAASERDGPDLAHGGAIYAEACALCHGADGQGGHGGGLPLTPATSAEEKIAVATTGRNAMPAFSGVYQPAEIEDVVAYIQAELTPNALP